MTSLWVEWEYNVLYMHLTYIFSEYYVADNISFYSHGDKNFIEFYKINCEIKNQEHWYFSYWAKNLKIITYCRCSTYTFEGLEYLENKCFLTEYVRNNLLLLSSILERLASRIESPYIGARVLEGCLLRFQSVCKFNTS